MHSLPLELTSHLLFIKIFAGLRKVNPYYFTFTTFTKGRWVGETILEVFSREFRAQPQQEYVRRFGGKKIVIQKPFLLQERCINAGTLTVNFEKVETDYRLKHNDLLANIVHRLVCCLTYSQFHFI